MLLLKTVIWKKNYAEKDLIKKIGFWMDTIPSYAALSGNVTPI